MAPRSFKVYASDGSSYVTLANGAYLDSTYAGFTGTSYVVLPPHVFGDPNQPEVTFTFWWDGQTGFLHPNFAPLYRYANWGDSSNSSGFSRTMNGQGLTSGHFQTTASTPGYNDVNRFRVYQEGGNVVTYPPTGGASDYGPNYSWDTSFMGQYMVPGWNSFKISKFSGTYDSHIDWVFFGGALSASVQTFGILETGQNISLFLNQTYVYTIEAPSEEWLWDFDDGSPTDATSGPNHVYYNPGTYTVTVATNIGHLGVEVFSLVVVIGGDPIEPPDPDPDPVSRTDFSWSQIVSSVDSIMYHAPPFSRSRDGNNIDGGYLGGASTYSHRWASVYVPQQVANGLRSLIHVEVFNGNAASLSLGMKAQLISGGLTQISAVHPFSVTGTTVEVDLVLEWTLPTLSTSAGFWVVYILDAAHVVDESFSPFSIFSSLTVYSTLMLPASALLAPTSTGVWREI